MTTAGDELAEDLRLSRRTVLAASAATAGALAVGAARDAGAQGGPVHPGRDAGPVLHAVRRLTYGQTPHLLAHVGQVGIGGWLDDQLRDDRDPAADVVHASYPTTSWPALLLQQEHGRNAVRELQAATFTRAAWGERQLEELLVELWSNHLSIYAAAGDVQALKVVDDREVVRPHALGRFSDLLLASARSPAMLRYLDNASSRGKRPNENYARELLELHTVSLAARFTHRDVRDTARVFTGWTVDSGTGTFTYRPEWHDVGPVRVLGWSARNDDPAAGVELGTSLLRYLSTRRATALNVTGKIVRRLVGDDPPSRLVSSAAQVFLDSGTQIVPVVRHVVGSAEFAAAVGRKGQRPLEWLAASVRALGLQHEPQVGLDGGGALVDVLRTLGQVPFGWPAPDGYPDTAPAWASAGTVLARWNVAQVLVHGQVKGVRPFDPAAFLGSETPQSPDALVDLVARRLLGAPPRSGLREALRQALDGTRGPLSAQQARDLTRPVAALVLSSPDMAVR